MRAERARSGYGVAVVESNQTAGVTLAPTPDARAVAQPGFGPTGLRWRIGAGLLWLALVLLAYYAVHKPVTPADWQAFLTPPAAAHWSLPATATRLSGALLDLLSAAWLLLLAGALGDAAWRAARWPSQGTALPRLSGTLLGLAALGLALFGAGLLGWLTLPVVLAVLVAPSLLLWRGLWRQARWWAASAARWWRAVWAASRIERLLACFVAATGTLVLIASLLPPTTAWDALSYHLVSARQDAASGRIVLDPANPQLYLPALTEMLYTALYLLRGGDGAAAPLHAGIGLVLLGHIAWWGWRMAGPRGSVRAAALVLAIPTVALLAGWPYVDLFLAAAELSAFLALTRWAATSRAGHPAEARGWLVVAGLSAGAALDIKYTAAYALAALALLTLAAAWAEPRARSRAHLPAARRAWAVLQPAVVFAGLAALIGSPWLIRNLLVAGDPFFPYHLGPFFPGGPDWDAGRTAFMQGHGWGLSALWRAPLLPLETVLLGQQGSSEFDATLGPLLLLLLPLGALTLARRRLRDVPPSSRFDRLAALAGHWLCWPLGFALLMGLIWAEQLAGSQVAMQSRLFLILYLVLAVPAAVAWLRLEAVALPSLSLARLATAGVLLCLALTLLTQSLQTLAADNLAELAGAQPRAAYEDQQLGPYAAAMRRLDALPPGARVLLLGEPRSYLTHAHVQPDVFLDALDTLSRRCGDAAGITRCLRQQGVSYVLCYQQGLRLLQAGPRTRAAAAEYAALSAATRTWQPIYRDDMPLIGPGPAGTGWYVLYALEPAP